MGQKNIFEQEIATLVCFSTVKFKENQVLANMENSKHLSSLDYFNITRSLVGCDLGHPPLLAVSCKDGQLDTIS